MITELPLIFDIARGSSVDGPGLRTVIFFKGCPLRCIWCQNPESQSILNEVFYNKELCINCGKCNEGCNSLAKINVGQYYSPEKLIKYILRDKIFYDSSGGGVTFSGGEPLLFTKYLSQILHDLRKHDIHIAVETCGDFDYDEAEKTVLQFIGLFLYDIKIYNPDEHKKYTGKTNHNIIENFTRLIESGKKVHPRIPLIPGITTTKKNLSGIAELFFEFDIREYSFLPYNTSGLEKYRRLNRQVSKLIPRKPLSIELERNLKKYFMDYLLNQDDKKLIKTHYETISLK